MYNSRFHNVNNNQKSFSFDKSKLTQKDLEVLEAANFPLELPFKKAMQKTIKKQYANNGFIAKQSISLEDVRYKVTEHKVAVSMYKTDMATLEKGKEFYDSIIMPEAKENYFITSDFYQQELEWLLNTFSQPKATPSMSAIAENEAANLKAALEAEKEKNNKLEQEKAELEAANEKGLTKSIINKIKKLNKEGKDAQEIAAALDMEKDSVIEVLKSIQ